MTPNELKGGTALSAPPSARSIVAEQVPPWAHLPPPPKPKPFEPPPPAAKVVDTIEALPLGGGYAVACIARRELMRPRYIDEPFTALDIVTRTGMRNTARNRSNVASSLSNFSRPGPQQFLEKVAGAYPATFIRITEPPPEKLRAKPNRQPDAIDPAPSPAPKASITPEVEKLLKTWDDEDPQAGTARDLTHDPKADFRDILDQRLKDEAEFLAWVLEEYKSVKAPPPKPLADYTDDELWDDNQRIMGEMARRRKVGK